MKAARKRARWVHVGRPEAWLTLGLIAVFLSIWAFFFTEVHTSFVAEVDTTLVSFVTGDDEKGDDGTGLFAPSGALNVAIRGCTGLTSLDPESAQVHCNHEQLELGNVRFASLGLEAGTKITLSVLHDGMVRMQFNPPGDPRNLRLVLTSTSGKSQFFGQDPEDPDKAAALAGGEWLVEPGANAFVLTIDELDGGRSLQSEVGIRLLDTSAVFMEEHGESALTGHGNQLKIARTGATIALDQSRLAPLNLEKASIRQLHWIPGANSRISAMHLVLAGRSDNLQVYEEYSDDPVNEAISPFDHWTNARSLRPFEVAGAAILSFGTLASAVASVFSALASRKSAAATVGLLENDLRNQERNSNSQGENSSDQGKRV